MAVGAAAVSNSSSRTGPARPPTLRPRRSCGRLPDGYTLLLVNAANAINATYYENLNYNFMRDIAPVAGIGRFPYFMAVNPSFPAKNVAEFIAYAKANPRQDQHGDRRRRRPGSCLGRVAAS